MPRTETLEICRKYLFENPTKELAPQTNDLLIRIRAAYAHWVEFPMKTDNEIRLFIQDNYSVEKTCAYYDLSILKILLGSIKNASKEWHRYTVIEMIKEAYDLAKDKQDPKAMILAVDKLGKYTQLHLPDIDPIPYEDIVPQPFEPSSDPAVVGLKPIADLAAKIKKLKEKYAAEIDSNVIDVEYTELTPDAK